MEIKNRTLYDKNLILSYNNYYLLSYTKRNFLVISIITIIFVVYMLMIEQWLYAVVLVCVLLLYLLLSIFLQKITTKRMLKRSPLVEQPILQSYIFSDENFTVTNLKSAVVSYDDVTKFKAAKDFYLIQTVNRKTFLVLFDGFDSDREKDEFYNFMVDRLGLKKH